MKKELYYEVRTKSGVVISQFMNIGAMQRWLDRRKHFSYLPTYQIFRITKSEERVHDFTQQIEHTARLGISIQQKPSDDTVEEGAAVIRI